MDIQRILIIGSLALLSFMMLVEWQQFSDAHKEAAQQQSNTQSVEQNSRNYAGNEGHTEELPESLSIETDSGIPTETLPSQSAEVKAETPVVAARATTSDSLITVTTDLMIAKINPRGGDIVDLRLRNHHVELGKSDQPFVLLEDNTSRSYIAQSGLIGPNATDTPDGRPLFKVEQSEYVMGDDNEEIVVRLHLETDNNVSITKQFIFRPKDYLVSLEYEISNKGLENWQAGIFGQIRRDSTPDPSSQSGIFSVKPFLGFAITSDEDPYQKFDFEDISEKTIDQKTEGGWIAMVQHYFISAWIPDASYQYQYTLLQTSSGTNIGRFTSPLISVAPGNTKVISADFYAGPKDQYRLADISAGLDLTVDYGWLWWIAQPLFALLHFFATGQLHIGSWSTDLGSGIGNWGWSIILLTLLIKALFFRLSATSYKSMANMRKLQPKMAELKDRYGDDRQKMSQATMELYRKEKVNPLGGCLPILIQMPVFIALYWTLMESVELRHAPWLGWITDLSAMDPYFVLPLLMGASMFFQQKLNPPPPDPTQAKIFQMMPIVFTVFFLWFPSGLVLYWLVNNLLSIAQQWVITRRIERQA